MNTHVIQLLVEHFGGVNALAKAVGVSSQAVSQWLSGDTRPSIENAFAIERITEGAFRWQEVRADLAARLDSNAPAAA